MTTLQTSDTIIPEKGEVPSRPAKPSSSDMANSDQDYGNDDAVETIRCIVETRRISGINGLHGARLCSQCVQ